MAHAGSPRRVLLADADAFYVSVARLVDPAGAGAARLLIVGGSPERRGVVTSASYEARGFGVHSAMPMARAVRLCPGALVVPVPWEACAAKSEEIRAVLERFAPVVERASSDEFYADLTGTERLYGGEPLAATAARIRAAVREATGLSVTIGGGTSKLVAKLAATVAKPTPGAPGAGVHTVAPGGEAAFLARFALADLPGVGPKFRERLARAGLVRVADAQRLARAALCARLGEREGAWLHDCVHGVDDAPVESRRAPVSLSRDETFAADLSDAAELDRALAGLVARAAADLRADGLAARTVTVRLRDADFTVRQASRTVPEPVISDRAVLVLARPLLARLRAERPVPARLLGVKLSSFAPEGSGQLRLFDDAPGRLETPRDRTLARLVDAVRERFGRDALSWGG